MPIGSLRSAITTRGIGFVAGVMLALNGCTNPGQQPNLNLLLAERFIDAFYSWSPNALSTVLAKAPADSHRTLYYQAWAESGDYQIQTRRPCTITSPSQAECAITVTDNIGAALGYIATDTFKLSFANNNLVAVRFTSDDPPILQELFAWLQKNRPEVFAGPCKGLFEDGTTPGACIRAVVQGAKDYPGAAP